MSIIAVIFYCFFLTDGGKSVNKGKNENTQKQSSPAATVLVIKPGNENNANNDTEVEQEPVLKQNNPAATQLNGTQNNATNAAQNAAKTTLPGNTILLPN